MHNDNVKLCGLVTFILAYLGYKKFSGAKGSTKGAVITIIISVVIIFLSEYFGLAYAIYDLYKGESYDISFIDAVRVTPEFLREPEVLIGVIRDLAIAYVFGAIASFNTIKQSFK